MIATCANPACNVPFFYFRIGKIFVLEANGVDPRSRIDSPKRGIEYFWLCGGMRPNHALDANDGRGSQYLPTSPAF
jgi:hypothetical protein